MEYFKDSIIIDAHNDLLKDIVIQRNNGRNKVLETDYLPGFKKGNVDLLVLSIHLEDTQVHEMALHHALDQISALYSDIEESFDYFKLCKSYDDIETTRKEGKIAFVLSFEGIEPLYDDLNLLKIFYELGVRIVGLVWSRRNYAADGCHYSPVREGQQGGLTEFGIKLVEKAEELGMFVDVSHLNDPGFWDVIKYTSKPIIASHSNCRTITNTPRNLNDEQIKAIAEKNGVIGINASSFLASDNDETSTILKLVDHMDYIIKLVGPKHLGLGFDFCDNVMKYVTSSSVLNASRKPFDILKGHGDIGKLIEEMLNRSYKDSDIKLILGENFLRVFKEAFKV